MNIRSTHIAAAYIALIKKNGGVEAARMLTEFLQGKKITGLLPQIHAHVRAYVKKQSAHDTLHITVPYEATQATLDMITDYTHRTTGSHPHDVRIHVDARLIGGFVTTFRGTKTDASVERMLHTLQTK